MTKRNTMLQYITNPQAPTSIADQAEAVIKGGCRWILLRTGELAGDELTAAVDRIKRLCLDSGAFLLTYGDVEMAKEMDLGGSFLLPTSMLPMKARTFLGPAAVIGVSTSNAEELRAVTSLDIDYIGFPLSEETMARENVNAFIQHLAVNDITLPCVVYGDSIRRDQLEAIVRSGANGIALSDAIAFSDDMVKATEEIISIIGRF